MSNKVKNTSTTHEWDYTSKNRVTRFVVQRSQWVKGFGWQLVFIGEKNLAVEFHVRLWAWILQIHSYVRFGGVRRETRAKTLKPLHRRANSERW